MPGPGFYWIGEEEKREVLEVIDSGHLFRYGSDDNPKFLQKTRRFEEEFAKYSGAKHALLLNSGTSALWVALMAMGLEPGDEVIVPAYTFVASYAAIIFAGGVPVLAEIDDSLTIDPQDIERRITPRTRAIMPVHMLGNPCQMDAIMAIAQKHGLQVLEDVCQAGGGSYHGRKLGNIGKAGAFSLNVFKTITTGDGGILITDDDQIYEHAFALHDQGHAPLRRGLGIDIAGEEEAAEGVACRRQRIPVPHARRSLRRVCYALYRDLRQRREGRTRQQGIWQQDHRPERLARLCQYRTHQSLPARSRPAARQGCVSPNG
jgi:dTDP-4-amino-4,6-dideoxygalactose transaminase